MANLEVTYKGNKIIETNESATKTLKTLGKYCEDDIKIDYTAGGGSDDGYDIIITDNEDGTQSWDVKKGKHEPVTTPITITENGVYEPPYGVDGFSSIIANITKILPMTNFSEIEYTQAEDWLTTSTGGLGDSYLIYTPKPTTGAALYYVVNTTPARIYREFDAGIVAWNSQNNTASNVLWRGNFAEARNFTTDTAVFIKAGTKLKVWKFEFKDIKEWAKENVN